MNSTPTNGDEAAVKAMAMFAASHVEARMEYDPCDDCGADGGVPCDDECGRAADERTVTDGVAAIASITAERDSIRAQLASAQSAPEVGWVKCSERMPTRADGFVLGWAPGCRPSMVWISDLPPDCKACAGCPKGPHLHGGIDRPGAWLHEPGHNATHWRPLPPPPAREGAVPAVSQRDHPAIPGPCPICGGGHRSQNCQHPSA